MRVLHGLQWSFAVWNSSLVLNESYSQMLACPFSHTWCESVTVLLRSCGTFFPADFSRMMVLVSPCWNDDSLVTMAL